MDAHGLQDLEHVLASWAKKSEEDSGQNELHKKSSTHTMKPKKQLNWILSS